MTTVITSAALTYTQASTSRAMIMTSSEHSFFREGYFFTGNKKKVFKRKDI